MLWLKSFHVIFMVTWFAGLFYLPRLYVYHASTTDTPGKERFKIMERKLFVMMTIGGLLTAVFGLAVLFAVPVVVRTAWLQMGWLHAKLTLVAVLIGYHVWCYRLLVAFRNDANRHSERWYRLFNEVPTLPLIAIVILVIVKPF
ncbi:MAG: CopD family protein [Steroidobacteraceae bacterium]